MLILVFACGKKSQEAPVKSELPTAPKVVEKSILNLEIKSAANQDNVEEVKRLLSQSPELEIDQFFDDGETLLTSSIKNNSLNVIELLIEKNVSLSKANRFGETPLILATKGDQIELISRLIDLLKKNKMSESINAEDFKGRSALFHAILNKFNDLAIFLINQGADVEISDNAGTTPLKLAQELGLKSVVAMIQYINETNNGFPSKSNFLNLLTYGSSQLLESILIKYPGLLTEYESESALIKIAAHSNPDEAIAMSALAIKYGAKVDGTRGSLSTPLIEAIKNNQIYLAELYFKYNANPNRLDGEGNSPLYWAISKINLAAINLLKANLVLENYSYWIQGERVSFNACSKVREVKRTLTDETSKIELKKIQEILRCGRSIFF